MNNVPNILVFDSGIGGISVYNEIRQMIPQANYFYLFDNQAFPYGDKSNEFLINRVTNVIGMALRYYSIDLIVIACNTASTICLPTLRQIFSLPIVGVVPAIKPATKITQNKCIGLLATKATIQREYTRKLINDFAKGYHIELLGLSELALIVEKKLQGIPVNLNELKLLLNSWLELPIIPDTIVLGCTHYPFIKDELKSIFPCSTLIDSGTAIAARVNSLLKEQINLLPNKSKQTTNLVCSTMYNQQVQKLIDHLKLYNLTKYKLINMRLD